MLTPAEQSSARAIRATLDKAGSLTNADAFRAALRASREMHGDARHEAVKFHALHAKV